MTDAKILSPTGADAKPSVGVFRVALCGNPNSGKSTLFNALTGLHQHVANFPGVTVEQAVGHIGSSDTGSRVELIDIPGLYSLTVHSPDEAIAAKALTRDSADGKLNGIVCVLDAGNLQRSLAFSLQLRQFGLPMVVVLNMADQASRQGMKIDSGVLSRELGGVPVYETVANRGVGIERLREAIIAVSRVNIRLSPPALPDPRLQIAVDRLRRAAGEHSISNAQLLKLLFADMYEPPAGLPVRESAVLEGERQLLREELRTQFGTLGDAETNPFTGDAARICSLVVSRSGDRSRRFSARLDSVFLHPVLGPVILVGILVLIFQSIFTWAGPLMNMIELVFGSLKLSVSGLMPDGPLRSLITDGIIGGVGSVLMFIPQIAILFLAIALLEDSGYVTRAAFLSDRFFRFCGLSGKSLIPMLSSFACAIPGIMATRTIENRKQRLITILVSPLMTCSARLPVYAVLIAAFIPPVSVAGVFTLQGLVLAGLYFLGVIVAMLVAFVLHKFLYKSERGTFIMEMPSYQWPTARSVFFRVYHRTRAFVVSAGTIILAITVLVWAASYFPRDPGIERAANEASVQISSEHFGHLTRIEAAIEADTHLLTPAELEALTPVRGMIAAAESRDELAVIPVPDDLTNPLMAELLMYEQMRRMLALDLDRSLDSIANVAAGEQIRQSYFARLGQWLEPLFAPLGWDWRITMAALASFPAREVLIAALGTIYNLGSEVDDTSPTLINKLRSSTRDTGPNIGEPVYSPAVALSIMVFFALCCQCGATVSTIRQETGSWWAAAGAFTYMTLLAYIGAFLVFQGTRSVGW